MTFSLKSLRPTAARMMGAAITRPIAASAQTSSEGEKQGHGIEGKEAALFVLIVYDVQGIDDCLHAAVGTPGREQQAQAKAKPSLRPPLKCAVHGKRYSLSTVASDGDRPKFRYPGKISTR